MKLRTRLFLWVGIVFLLAFAVSLGLEVYLTDQKLKDAENSLRQRIFSINEERRQHIERYLRVVLSEDQAQIDSLLLRLGRDPDLGPALFLNPKDLQLVAPAHSAYLFKTAPWIDFIQSTKQGELTSLLVPLEFPMNIAHKIPITKDYFWVALDTDENLQHPLLGVRIPLNKEKFGEDNLSLHEFIDSHSGLSLFFLPESLLHRELSQDDFAGGETFIDLTALEKTLDEAAAYLRAEKAKYSGRDWVQKAMGSPSDRGFFDQKLQDRELNCLHSSAKQINSRIIELLERQDQALMLAILAQLYTTQDFGFSPFTKGAPKGIGRFQGDQKTGLSLLTSQIFLKNKLFDDSSYYQKHPSSEGCGGMGSGLAIIVSGDKNHVFIGNTLEIKDKNEVGYLTIGINSQDLLEDLALSVNQIAFLVHDDKVITGMDANGNPMSDAQTALSLSSELLKKKSGILTWKGEKYYFLQLTPIPGLDLHFYLMQPEKKAFALVNAIDEGSREVIKSVSVNMRLVAGIALIFVLLLLHRIARRITKPIAQLAQITHEVAAGKLEGIVPPQSPPGRHDEVADLCQSFAKMITGLQEKEKVKGVLNKVVSPEIAEEITKGQIHLGGEEKLITVFFADIRNFTHMSENMAPREVVEMLNTCMTKISHVIDEFGGVIDKYVGDEVMALFGAPLEKEDSALKAVQCAEQMISVLKQWNEERKGNNLPPVEVGIGIHTGLVLVGNMGAENRLNYTVIGSNVNLAARMCSIAKGMEILISEETLEQNGVRDHFKVEKLPPTELKGFHQSFILYKVTKGK